MTNTATTNQFADVVDAAVAHPDARDVSKEAKGGFDRKPAREGVALFRLRSYIETGQHTVKKGQGKGKVQQWADLEFELVHPDHMIGPDDKKFPDTIRVRDLNVSMNPKASYFKLFKAMNYDGQYTSFAQMLGHGFLGRVVHNVVGDNTYVNMRDDGNWLIGRPSYTPDPINAPETVVEVPVPELHGDVQLFLWEAPGIDAPMVQKMWDSIEIIGEKEDGTPYKNWIQEKVRSNMEWEGSFTQSVVGGAAIVADAVADDVAKATAAAVTAEVQTMGTNGEPDLVQPPADATVVDQQNNVVDPLAGIAGL